MICSSTDKTEAAPALLAAAGAADYLLGDGLRQVKAYRARIRPCADTTRKNIVNG